MTTLIGSDRGQSIDDALDVALADIRRLMLERARTRTDDELPGLGVDAAPIPDAWTGWHIRLDMSGDYATAAPAPPWARCQRCDGLGDTLETVNGRTYAKACRCKELQARIEAFDRARLPSASVRRLMASHRWARVPDALEVVAKDIVRRWDLWRQGCDRPGVVISGANQVGKTQLLMWLAYHVTTKHAGRVRYYLCQDLYSELRLAVGDGTLEQLTRVLSGQLVELLLLDDLGQGASGTRWSTEQYEAVLGRRVEAGLPTVVATKLMPTDQGTLAGEIGSRVWGRVEGYSEVVVWV